MLELQNISKTFEDRTVLDDVSLLVPKGATHALIGSSGSGKTTLLRITLGLIPFDRGYVKINDQALLSFTQVEWAVYQAQLCSAGRFGSGVRTLWTRSRGVHRSKPEAGGEV